MSLKDLFLSDASAAFLNSSEFGEQVVYIKRDGTTRTINAIVDRTPPERVTSNGQVWAPKLTVSVANSATLGILAAELDAYGNDRIRTCLRPGGTTYDFGAFIPPPGQPWIDEGIITLELR